MNNKYYFDENGFFTFRPKINDETFNKALKAFKLILEKSQNELYKKIRVYDDYFLKINVSGIENIFDEQNQKETFDWFMNNIQLFIDTFSGYINKYKQTNK